MSSIDVYFFEVPLYCWSSHHVFGDFTHVAYCVQFLDVELVEFFYVLFEFGFGKVLLGFEREDVIVDLLARAPQEEGNFEELVLRVGSGEVAVSWGGEPVGI